MRMALSGVHTYKVAYPTELLLLNKCRVTGYDLPHLHTQCYTVSLSPTYITSVTQYHSAPPTYPVSHGITQPHIHTQCHRVSLSPTYIPSVTRHHSAPHTNPVSHGITQPPPTYPMSHGITQPHLTVTMTLQ